MATINLKVINLGIVGNVFKMMRDKNEPKIMTREYNSLLLQVTSNTIDKKILV